jgi:hypothetical protein
MNTPNLPDDKITNDALLCMVFPEYAIKFCKTVPITTIEPSVTADVLFAVLDWYLKNYHRSGDWFLDGIRPPSASEITNGMNHRTKVHAEEIIAFRDSSKCLERFIANANSINFA